MNGIAEPRIAAISTQATFTPRGLPADAVASYPAQKYRRVASILDRPLRAGILAAADNPLVRRAVTRYGMRLGARRFVAGENVTQLLAAARAANAEGFAVAATLLGESIDATQRDDGSHRRVLPPARRICR